MDAKNQIANEHRNLQSKYIYYLIALAVACVGYSIHSSANDILATRHIILGMAVLAWIASVVCGLIFLKYALSMLYDNFTLFRIRDGEEELTGSDPYKIQVGIEAVKELIEEKQKSSMRFARWQEYLLGLGGLSYLGWHIISMLANSSSVIV
jgi:hypothetical protein